MMKLEVRHKSSTATFFNAAGLMTSTSALHIICIGGDMKYKTIEYLDSARTDVSVERSALADARKIAKYLNEECDAVVFGIGSLFEAEREFGPGSDIDLVVEGIPPGRFFSITAAAASMTRFDLDIIPLEEADELIKQWVCECGVRL